jgi:hypothetical protein
VAHIVDPAGLAGRARGAVTAAMAGMVAWALVAHRWPRRGPVRPRSFDGVGAIGRKQRVVGVLT